MASNLILATLFFALLAAVNAQRLTGCDDCYSPRTRLRYGPIYFGGRQYGAFAVGSNGHIVLLSSTGESIRGYSYNPTPISQTEGSPMIAGFWSDINLACRGTTNAVIYRESCSSSELRSVRRAGFNPTRILIVKYDAVQRYTCPRSCDANTFTIKIATDPRTCQSYLFLEYDGMSWNKATPSYNNPVVGYSNGRCQGRSLLLTSNPASYLNRCRRWVFRIDQRFAQEVEAEGLNRGSLAALMQQQEEEQQLDEGATFVQQGKPEVALQQQKPQVIEQEFAEKVDMQNQLSEALQQVDESQENVIVQDFVKE